MLIISFGAGILCCLALEPYNLWPFMLIGIASFYYFLSQIESTKDAFLNGCSFGLGYFLLGLYWIGNAVFIHWDQYWWLYPFAVLGLPILLAVFWGIASWLSIKFSRRKSFLRSIYFILSLSLIEWVRGWVFTGFPWNLPGYAWGSVLEIVQIVSFGGIYFLTLLTITAGVFIGLAITKKRYLFLLLPLLMFSSLYWWGSERLKNNPIETDNKSGFLIVQPSIPQTQKWDPSFIPDNIRALINLSSYDVETIGSDLPDNIFILWPETALSQPYFEHSAIKKEVVSMLKNWPVDTYLMTGIIRNEKEGSSNKYYNSIYKISSQGKIISTYDKKHLVPFGEYIPFIPPEILAPMNIVNFEHGKNQASFNTKGLNFMPLICYEAIFPELLHTQKQHDAIIVTTNDAWYNDAPGPYQHHRMAMFRAIEQGTPLFRAANTGISGAFDSFGRKIMKDIPYNKRAAIFVNTPKSLNKKTFFSKNGNNIFFSTIGFLLFLSMVLKKKLY